MDLRTKPPPTGLASDGGHLTLVALATSKRTPASGFLFNLTLSLSDFLLQTVFCSDLQSFTSLEK
jgi:hypothetical protein